MKKIIFRAMLLFFVGGIVSCSDFGDINVDPNNPTFVGTETLLTNAQRSVSGVISSSTAAQYAQHIGSITYTSASRYSGTQASFEGFYSGPLSDLQTIISLNEDPETASKVLAGGSNSNQIAVARILKAYFFNHMVERWGPIPYTEALKGADNFLPVYDSEETVYNGLFKDLTEAAAALDGGSIKGDILLGGDTNKWKLFANTLRGKIALKLSDVAPAIAKAEFSSAYAAGFLEESMVYDYLAESNNENPWFSAYRTRKDFGLSNTMYDYLTATNDPRLTSFADPTEDGGLIAAIPYGLRNSQFLDKDISLPNSTYIRAQDVDIPIISKAQVELMKAEGVARGFIEGDAEAFYNAAVEASMERWGVTDAAAISAYLAQDNVKYNAADWKKSIAGQLWVCQYMQGYDCWTDIRRFDYPTMYDVEAPLNPAEGFPVRNMYGSSEGNLNVDNYNAAVALLGGTDSDAVRLWWDVN